MVCRDSSFQAKAWIQALAIYFQAICFSFLCTNWKLLDSFQAHSCFLTGNPWFDFGPRSCIPWNFLANLISISWDSFMVVKALYMSFSWVPRMNKLFGKPDFCKLGKFQGGESPWYVFFLSATDGQNANPVTHHTLLWSCTDTVSWACQAGCCQHRQVWEGGVTAEAGDGEKRGALWGGAGQGEVKTHHGGKGRQSHLHNY